MATSALDGPPTNSPPLPSTPPSPLHTRKVRREEKKKKKKSQPRAPFQPGLLLRLFLEPKSLTREKTFNLFLSQLVLPLLGLLTHLQAFDFSRSRACRFCRMSELAIAAAMATTPTTTTSFAAPLRVRLLLPRLRRSPGRTRASAALVSGAGACPGFSALGLQPRRGLSIPAELLRRWSGSRAGGRLAWVRADATAQGRDRGRDWLAGGGGRAALVRALGPCARRTLCESKWLGSEFGGTPRPVPRGGGRRREAGGGRERGREREAGSAGGGREGGMEEPCGVGGGGVGGARPRPGPSEPPTSPCNFLARRSGKVGPCQLSDAAQTGNGLASSLPPLPPLLLWARHRLSIGILSPQAPSGRARRPPAAPSPGGPSLPEPSPLAPRRRPPPPAPSPQVPGGPLGLTPVGAPALPHLPNPPPQRSLGRKQ